MQLRANAVLLRFSDIPRLPGRCSDIAAGLDHSIRHPIDPVRGESGGLSPSASAKWALDEPSNFSPEMQPPHAGVALYTIPLRMRES